jgi:hypothetical protein
MIHCPARYRVEHIASCSSMCARCLQAFVPCRLHQATYMTSRSKIHANVSIVGLSEGTDLAVCGQGRSKTSSTSAPPAATGGASSRSCVGSPQGRSEAAAVRCGLESVLVDAVARVHCMTALGFASCKHVPTTIYLVSYRGLLADWTNCGRRCLPCRETAGAIQQHCHVAVT